MDAAALLAAEASLLAGDKSRLPELQRQYFAALKEAKRLNPKNLESRRILIDNLKRFGDWTGAARECGETLSQFPQEAGFAPTALELGLKLVELAGKNAGASQDGVLQGYRLVEQALTAKPDYADAHREAARIILFRLGERRELLPKALEHAQAAVRWSPQPANYDILAGVYFRAGQPDLAQKSLEEGLVRHPGDATLKDRLDRFRQSRQGN
jgi:tetratricopeptide (TPR) repeat protein